MSRVNAWAFAEPRVLDDNNDPVSGGGAYIYEAGTTTQIAVTSDKDGNTAVTQPITADAAGRLPDSYILPQSFKIVYVDASGTELQTIDNIEVAGGTYVYDTYALLTAATGIPASQAHFQTLGYYARGDGGGADYVRVASEPAHEFKTTVNGGAVFVEGLPRDGVLNTRCLGAVCDVTGDYNATSSGAFASENAVINAATDDTAAIQNAINYALHYEGNSTSAQPLIVRHTGKSRITDTIQLGWGVTTSSIRFEGPWAILRGEDSMAGGGLFCTFTDRMMINIQGARGTSVANLFLRGGLDYSGVTATVTGLTPTVEANWDAVQAPLQYSQHALITIDAYCGTRPATSYPDVTYPAWMGAVPQYGKLVSSRIDVDGVIGRNAQSFIINKPCDDSSNGDFLQIDNCHYEYVKHFVSMGNSQGRNFSLNNCEGGRAFDLLVNGIHGQQTGQFGGPIRNLSGGSFINRVFHFTSSATIGSTTSFENVFMEGIHRLGDLDGATSGDTPMVFNNCRMNFRHDDTNGVPPNVADFANCTASVSFNNCEFKGFPDVVKIDGCLNPIVDGCTVDDAVPSSATRLVHNATTGGLVFSADPKYPADLRSCTFSQRNVDTGAETRVVADWRLETTGRTYCVPIYLRRACHPSGGVAQYRIDQDRPLYRNQIPKSSCWSSASRSDKVITHTWTSMTLDTMYWRGGYIGDIWIDNTTGTTGYVTTAVTNGSDVDMTSTLLNNYVDDGASGYDLFDTSLSLTTGNVSFLNCRVYATSAPLLGRSTSSSATLETRSGSSATEASILGNLEVGDIWANPQRAPNAWTSAAGSKISSISDPDITMGGTAAETWGTGGSYLLKLNYWIRDEV